MIQKGRVTLKNPRTALYAAAPDVHRAASASWWVLQGGRV